MRRKTPDGIGSRVRRIVRSTAPGAVLSNSSCCTCGQCGRQEHSGQYRRGVTNSLYRNETPRRAVVHRLAWQVPLGIVLCVLSIAALGARFELAGCLYLALVTPELCRVDIAEHRLPNRLVVPGLAVAVVGVAFGGLADGHVPAGAALGAVAVGIFFALLALAGGLGMGDVKLSVVLATAGGGVSAVIVVGTVVLGFLAAGLAAITALVARGAGGSIAFGPYLLGGFWASVAALPLFA
jgi:leader peptidase (prepilin peptidase)/N-methyltransferase